MSEFRSVLLFFGILVGFILVVALVFGRITLPGRSRASAVTPTVTVTVTPTKRCGLFGLFCRNTPTPVVTVVPTKMPTNTPALAKTTPVPGVTGVTSIPETGNPTLMLLIPSALGAVGYYLRKRR